MSHYNVLIYSQSKRTPQKVCLQTETAMPAKRLAQVWINFKLMRIWRIMAFDSNQGVYAVRDILFDYQTRCILIATSAIWSNVHQHMFTFSQTKWFTKPLDISHCKLFNSGGNDFHFSVVVVALFVFHIWPGPCVMC